MNGTAAEGPRPVDWVLAVYHAIAGIAWLPAMGSSSLAPWLVAAHALGLLLPFKLRGWGPGASPVARLLREAYPLLLLYPLFAEVGLLHRALGSAGHDAAVAGWDAAIFSLGGGGWHRAWAAAAPQAWLRETMHALYISYYPLLAGPPLAAALLRNGAAFRDMSYRLMLTYTACYAVYLFFPVFGPGHADPIAASEAARGFFPDLMRGLMASGDAPGTAFPSSHVAGVFTAAWLGYRWFPRPVAHAQLLLACGGGAATVYTHNHYPIDAASGFLYAWALQRGVARAVARAAGARAAPKA